MGGAPMIAYMLLAVLVVAHMPPAYAGCSASGVTGSDNADDCTALLAAYAAWGNKPMSWAAGIATGTSYCSWDTSTIRTCINSRVQYLCAARQPCQAVPGIEARRDGFRCPQVALQQPAQRHHPGDVGQLVMSKLSVRSPPALPGDARYRGETRRVPLPTGTSNTTSSTAPSRRRWAACRV